MDSTDEFAEQYTLKERVRFVLLWLTLGGAFVLGWKGWLLPRWAEFARTSQCYEFNGVSGIAVVFYTTFVGLPLFLALCMAILSSRRGLKILRDRQAPYKGEKVFRPTKIKRGRAAVVIGWQLVLAPLMFVAIAIWGEFQAGDLVRRIDPGKVDRSQCATIQQNL